MRIAFIQSSWHSDIVDESRLGFLEAVSPDDAEVEFFAVPGAFELPMHARLLAGLGRFDAVVAVGFVVDGGIYRHEFVASAVIDGLMRVQLDTDVPVFSGVLTPQSFHDDEAQRSFFIAHMREKGREVGRACLATLASRTAVLADA
jgi:6,7-dimethyl-8-ribityllumazine synthase